eukprot:31463-Pelagococcus_subviridis.AAC.2
MTSPRLPPGLTSHRSPTPHVAASAACRVRSVQRVSRSSKGVVGRESLKGIDRGAPRVGDRLKAKRVGAVNGEERHDRRAGSYGHLESNE